MRESELKSLLEEVESGSLEVDRALSKLKKLPFSDLKFAKVDHHRQMRTGFPEVIYCEGKNVEEIRAIASELIGSAETLLGTRADYEAYKAILDAAPDAEYHERSKMVTVDRRPAAEGSGLVVVACAGTADLPVAEEAALTSELIGAKVSLLADVGVAGVHRLLAHQEELDKAKVVVVVAGMDGVLPSVVGGLVSAPVIAVPTSVGYGSSFKGLAALLTMLNSCAPGVSVVNIDNGFGAGYLAGIINMSIVDSR
ncbi:MAG: nickel pincer cofactor biosynthesis protein LarB [Candidatus Aquicultorales bacterium]